MKHRLSEMPSLPTLPRRGEMGSDFIRGFVATSILSAVQDHPGKPRLDRRTLRLAMQGGSALAAASYAARAWQRGETGRTLAGIAAGLAAVATFEHLLQASAAKENEYGQEEA